MAYYTGPYYTGPFEDPLFVQDPLTGSCPVIKATRKEGLTKGPGWGYPYSYLNTGGYTSSCNTSYKYILHHTYTTKSSINRTNQPSCPNSWGNQQGITGRYPLTSTLDDVGSYDTYGNTDLGAQYYEYHDCVQNPDNTWNYTYTTWKTTMRFVYVPTYDNICPPGTVYNPDTGTCDVLDGWYWDPETEGYVASREYCLAISGENWMYAGKKTYPITLTVISTDEERTIDSPLDVTIYYNSQDAINGTHYTAPTKITIPAGSKTFSFDIETGYCFYDKYREVFITLHAQDVETGEVFDCDRFKFIINPCIDYSKQPNKPCCIKGFVERGNY